MKKTNVIEFVSDLNTGGAQSIVREYARLLNYERFSLTVATIYPAKQGANVELVRKTPAVLDSLYDSRSVMSKLDLRLSPQWLKSQRLLSIVRKHQADVIHVHLTLLKYLVPIRKQLQGVKLLYTCHSVPERNFADENAQEYLAAKILVEKNGLQFIALHEEMRRQLNTMFGVENTIVIRNGVDFERYTSMSETSQEIRAAIGISPSDFVLGHIGRFSDEKNHLFLIDIFAEVVRRRPNAHLLLVGTGRLVGTVMDRIASLGLMRKVTHLENRADIPQLVKAMDVFVFPSLYEGLPVSVVEAQVAGIRSVVSDRVTEECFFLPTLVVRSVDETPLSWAEAVLDDTLQGPFRKDISVFNMRNAIKQLEQLYSNK